MPPKADSIREVADFGRSQEVAMGLANEERILRRWQGTSEWAAGARGFIKGGRYDDFDFVVFGGDGLVICYLEVKLRRSPLSMFGDAIFPARKHDFALRARKERKTPVVAVTEYGCGSLVECRLWEAPDGRRDIARRDRPGTKPVPHVIYSKRQLTILEGDSA